MLQAIASVKDIRKAIKTQLEENERAKKALEKNRRDIHEDKDVQKKFAELNEFLLGLRVGPPIFSDGHKPSGPFPGRGIVLDGYMKMTSTIGRAATEPKKEGEGGRILTFRLTGTTKEGGWNDHTVIVLLDEVTVKFTGKNDVEFPVEKPVQAAIEVLEIADIVVKAMKETGMLIPRTKKVAAPTAATPVVVPTATPAPPAKATKPVAPKAVPATPAPAGK